MKLIINDFQFGYEVEETCARKNAHNSKARGNNHARNLRFLSKFYAVVVYLNLSPPMTFGTAIGSSFFSSSFYHDI